MSLYAKGILTIDTPAVQQSTNLPLDDAHLYRAPWGVLPELLALLRPHPHRNHSSRI